MIIIPAIDLKNSQAVRLSQGRMDDATVYSSDPVLRAEALAVADYPYHSLNAP